MAVVLIGGLTAGQKAQQVVSYTYNEWGAVTSGNTSHGSTGNGGGYYSTPFQYNGEALDISVSLQYLRARYYDPGTKRFLQQDTVWGKINVALSQNLYAYVQNSPLNFTDPSGHYLEEKQTYLNRIAEANDQISSLQAMMNNGASLATRSAIQDEISRLNSVLDESRRTLAVIEGQMSYQQAFPKYAQMMAEAGSGSVRPRCDINPGTRYLDPWADALAQAKSITVGNLWALFRNATEPIGDIFNFIQGLIWPDSQTPFTDYDAYEMWIYQDLGLEAEGFYTGKIIGDAESMILNVGLMLTGISEMANGISTITQLGGTSGGAATAIVSVSISGEGVLAGVGTLGATAVLGYGFNNYNVDFAKAKDAWDSSPWKPDKGEANTVTNNQGKEIDITPNKNHTTTNKNPGYKGESGSSIDILDKDGNVVTRRWFDENGNAIRDVDMTNHGNPKQHSEWPHEHLGEYGSDGKPISR